jgi:pimeloyl-ACP methyl ester carboxylesterase
MPRLQTRGASIAWRRTGTGPAVLLLQGVGVVGNGWRPQIDPLADRYTLVDIDNRGIGESTFDGGELSIEAMADDALAVLEAAGLERAHVVGHSMGGLIAQHVALTAPARVMSLTLMCTFLRGRQGSTPTLGMLPTAIRSRFGTRRMRRHAFLELILPPAALQGLDREVIAARLAVLFGHDLADQAPVTMTQLRTMGRYDASPKLSALAGIPTLVMSARHDRIALPAYGRALADAIPGAQFVEIADAGHALPIQCAPRVNAILEAHFAGHRAPVTPVV